jgi:hypothetical protein
MNTVASLARTISSLEDGTYALSISQQRFSISDDLESIFLESAVAALQDADDIR